MSLTTIDSVELLRVTGGAGQPPQPQGQAQPAAQPGGEAQGGGGNILEQFQQIISLFQSPNFQQVLAGLQQILGALQPTATAAAPQAGDQGQQQAAA